MVSTRKKRQEKKRLLTQLSDSDSDFMIGQSNHEPQTESRTNTVEENITPNKVNNPAQVNDSQVDVHTLEKNIAHKARSEVDNVMATVETRIQGAILIAIESLVIPMEELALKSVNPSSERDVNSLIPDPNQRDFQQILKPFR